MASPEELYVSISRESYRNGKSGILQSQESLLKTMKHLQTLTLLSRQKTEQKIILHRLLSSVLKSLDSLKEIMPSPRIPKSLKKEEPKEKEISFKSSEHRKIEDELLEIQHKLRQLNS